MLKNKRELPLFYRAKEIDLGKMLTWLDNNNLLDMSVYTAFTPESEYYQDSLVAREAFRKNFNTNDVFDTYHGLALTGFNDDRHERSAKEKLSIKRSKLELFKCGLYPESPDYIPELDERNYDKPGPYVNGYMKEFLDSFKSPPTRVRLAWADPGYQCVTHIDTSTEFSVRYHTPLITNDKSVLGFVIAGETVEKHLPADGGVWFFNHGYPHYLANRGSERRLHLLVSVNGQNDMEELFSE